MLQDNLYTQLMMSDHIGIALGTVNLLTLGYMKLVGLLACVVAFGFCPTLSFSQNPFPIDSNSGRILYRQSFHYPNQPSDTLFKYCYDCFMDLFFWGLEENMRIRNNSPTSPQHFSADTIHQMFLFRNGFRIYQDSAHLVDKMRVSIVSDRIACSITDFKYYTDKDLHTDIWYKDFDKIPKQPFEPRLKQETDFAKYLFVDSLCRGYISKLNSCILRRISAKDNR